MAFLTILAVIEILCSFRLVLQGRTGKEIPESSGLEFLENFLANNFVLSEAEENTSGSLNRGGITNLPSLRTLLAIRQKSREPNFREITNSFSFGSTCKFGNFKKPFTAITSLSDFYF